MDIYIGADHRGYQRKEFIKELLVESHESFGGIVVHDMGSFQYDEHDDFNDAAINVARAVREDPEARGILICGSGDGMCIQANRFKRVRAARCGNVNEARVAREHDDINVLCLAADELDDELTEQIIATFLKTAFDTSNEARMRRINRLDEGEDYD